MKKFELKKSAMAFGVGIGLDGRSAPSPVGAGGAVCSKGKIHAGIAKVAGICTTYRL